MKRQRWFTQWLPMITLSAAVCFLYAGCAESPNAPVSSEMADRDDYGNVAEAAKYDDEVTVQNEHGRPDRTASDFAVGGFAEEQPASESSSVPASTEAPGDASSSGTFDAPHSFADKESNPSSLPAPGPAPGGDVAMSSPLSPQDGQPDQGRNQTAASAKDGKNFGTEGSPQPETSKPLERGDDRGLKSSEVGTTPAPVSRGRSEGMVEDKGMGSGLRGGGFGGGIGFGLSKFAVDDETQRHMEIELQPGEELWIIAKAADVPGAARDDVPGTGSLMATLPNETTRVPVPLKHTSVEGNIDGYIATVDVKQQFHNPYDSKIEAVYVFPLPDNAAVNDFLMTVGDRKIRGIIREREKAEQIYAAARSQGHVAALMTQERPNIFTQKVANIEPGKQIDISIRYFNTLQYDDGAYEFVFPMVVGPRFNPPATTDGVGAVGRGAAGVSGQQAEVQYLAPNERSGHDISLSLNISAGVDIEDVNSINHAVKVKDICESQRQVTLSDNDHIPNRDFVLRYRVAGNQIKTAMLTHEDDNGKFFTMMLYPPADLSHVQRSPMEMVFVLDCSGSMKGQPIAQAKAAISHALQSLTPRDTFQIIRFSNNASQLGAEPILATDDNIKRGLQYLTSLNGSGGTQMIEGIKAALDFPHDEGRFRLVSFMTDGYIGNEQQILGTLHEKLGASRIFSFGVGNAPNRFLMDRMAILGRGAVAYLSLNDNATEIMDGFNQRISHPAMTDLAIDWGSMTVADVYPQRLPDLIVGRPVVVTGRFRGEPGTVKVNGRVNMEPASFAVALDDDDAAKAHHGIAAVWARLKIKDMMNYATHAPDAAAEIKDSVIETALAYNLMSSFTAFVAVDSLTQTEGDFGTTVAVPVPVPEGVKYETTVQGTN